MSWVLEIKIYDEEEDEWKFHGSHKETFQGVLLVILSHVSSLQIYRSSGPQANMHFYSVEHVAGWNYYRLLKFTKQNTKLSPLKWISDLPAQLWSWRFEV